MTLFVLLISTGISTLLFLGCGWWYLRARRLIKENMDESGDAQDVELAEVAVTATTQHEDWLDFIDKQIELCHELMTSSGQTDQDDMILRCWLAFLEIEKHVIEQNSVPLEPLLEKFEFVLESLKQAQAIDELLKQLSVSNTLLNELNKIVQKTGETVFSKTNVTSELSQQLDKLQAQLQKESQLDAQLAEVRAELASMYELAERLKTSPTAGKEMDEEYMGALSDFLGSASSDQFLTPIKTELDDKVQELQHLAEYRGQVIKELKGKLKSKRGSSVNHDPLTEYDIAFAKLEKNLLESNKVIKALEHKLESLQTIKYNLNVDVRKREEELKLKDAKLKATSGGARKNAQDAIAREQSSVDALAGFMDKVPLSSEFNEFEQEQTQKLAQLQLLVNESELYVNVLERDLEKEKEEHEQLVARLENRSTEDMTISEQELEELANLREINAELEEEKIELIDQLSQTSGDSQDSLALQQKIKELDMKIETIQANYVNMEERYLNSLMS